MSVSVDLVSPVGRLVQGDVVTPRTKDRMGNPLVVKNGPNAGQPTQSYIVSVAYAKDHPEWPAFYAKLYDCAMQNFPQLFDPVTRQCKHPSFAFKVMDGDGMDADGKDNKGKPGFAGHWVVRFSSQWAPKPLTKEGQLIPDPATASQTIKRGHFVRVIGTAKGNDGVGGKPGLFLSPGAVQWMGFGEEITSGPDFTGLAVAAGAASYMPPGMSAVPLAGAAPSIAAPGGLPTPPGASALPTPPGASALPTPPGALPTPPGALPTPPGAAALPTPPQPVYTMTAAAQGFTREQYIAQGYTDDMLIAQGIMTRSAPPPNPAFVAGAVAAALPTPPGASALPTPPGALPTPPVSKMTALANGATREALIAAGWTDATLIANGLMLP